MARNAIQAAFLPGDPKGYWHRRVDGVSIPGA